MSKTEFKGIKQVDGTNEEFNESSLEDGYLNLVRTNETKNEGYIFLNGKKYGSMKVIVTGETLQIDYW
jgi:hypothetical protein